MSNDDKTVLLQNAFEAIEQLPFRGRKMASDQEAAFPRLPFQYGEQDAEAPTNVKNAEVELALWMSDDSKQKSAEKRAQMISDGVKSFSLGDLSESYAGKPACSDFTAKSCQKCMNLLRQYLTGGFGTC